jgi:hypothetical protein
MSLWVEECVGIETLIVPDNSTRRKTSMPLKMKQSCQKCRQELVPDGEAYICSYECTFCEACTSEMAAVS